MQKLVLQYTEGDHWTWSSNIDSPFLYSSKENATIDFKFLVEKQETLLSAFVFAGLELTVWGFGFMERNKVVCWNSNILTLEEWFEQRHSK